MSLIDKITELKVQGSRLNHLFLESFLDGFLEGILIFDLSGTLIHANKAIFSLLEKSVSRLEDQQLLDQEIRSLFQVITKQVTGIPDEQSTSTVLPFSSLESEIALTRFIQLRIHVRRFQMNISPNEMVWIRIEDRHQMNRMKALIESQRYGLSTRESEVWLLRSAGYTNPEVSKKLFISVNTVKKHMRNILAKSELYHCRDSLVMNG